MDSAVTQNRLCQCPTCCVARVNPNSALLRLGLVVSVGTPAADIYYGYERNRDLVGWTIGRATLPAILIPVAPAQGLEKSEGKR